MEVIVHCALMGYPQDYVVVATDPTQAVDSLITAYCIEKGIAQHRHLVLKNSDGGSLECTKTLAAVGILNGDHLYIYSNKDTGEWCGGCNQWWLLSAVALLIGSAGIIAISLLKFQPQKMPYGYGVVIDAGSSHSQVYNYHWPGNKHNGTAVISQLHSCRREGGISDFSSDPSAAGPDLAHCLNDSVKAVPHHYLSETPLYLGATAGMRLLRAANASASDAIMSSVRTTMGKYPYNFSYPEKQAVIISGKDEGSFSWVTVNSALGSFGLNKWGKSLSKLLGFYLPSETYGALDLGGASTQITYQPKDIVQVPEEDRNSLLMYGVNYDVYTHSYLCYGLNEAYRKYHGLLVKENQYNTTVNDPCRPSGSSTVLPYKEVFEAPCTVYLAPNAPVENQNYTFVGQSDDEDCRKMSLKLFNTSCRVADPHCTFDNVFQPELHGNYMAFSGYYYTMNFYKNVFNLTGNINTTLEEFEEQMMEYCGYTWEEVKNKSNDTMRDRYCFNGHYIHSLLVEMYRFNASNWSRLHFTDQINGTDLGWTVGFMFNTSNTFPINLPESSISTTLFVFLLLLFIGFLAVAVGFVCHAHKLRKQKAQYQVLTTSYGSI